MFLRYQDARERSFAIWDEVAMRDTISAGYQHTVGPKVGGIVVAIGNKNLANALFPTGATSSQSVREVIIPLA